MIPYSQDTKNLYLLLQAQTLPSKSGVFHIPQDEIRAFYIERTAQRVRDRILFHAGREYYLYGVESTGARVS